MAATIVLDNGAHLAKIGASTDEQPRCYTKKLSKYWYFKEINYFKFLNPQYG